MIVVGIDPGTTGAVATLVDGKLVDVYDMEVIDGLMSEVLFVRHLRVIEVAAGTPSACVIEKVAARPGQHAGSMFKFATAYGIARCGPAAFDWPVHYVAPGTWKRAVGVTAVKETSRRKVTELWPDQADLFSRVKDHNRAEAALIGYWWWLRMQGQIAT